MPNRPQPRILQALFIAGAGIWLAAAPRRPRRSLLWSAVLLAADLIAIPAVLRAKPPITDDELQNAAAGFIPAIDRPALQLPVTGREAMRRSSDAMLRTLVAAPALLLLHPALRRGFRHWLPEYVWGHALTYTIYTFSPLGPAFTDKYRPVVYRREVPAEERRRGNSRSSQYSGHTGNAAFASFFMAGILAPHVRCGRLALYMLAAALALILGSLRVRAQKHFPSDVLAATGIGALFAAGRISSCTLGK